MEDNENIIERRGRKYEYCAGDDCWYPVPTRSQYDFQRFVLFISTILLICYVVALIAER